MSKNIRLAAIFTASLTVAFLVFMGILVAYGDWFEPSQPPPFGNVAAPINIGNNAQSKTGPLLINTGITNSLNNVGLMVGGKTKVGVPTTQSFNEPSQYQNLTEAFEVEGNIKALGDIEITGQIKPVIGGAPQTGASRDVLIRVGSNQMDWVKHDPPDYRPQYTLSSDWIQFDNATFNTCSPDSLSKTLNHNLGTLDTIVYLEGRPNMTAPVHQKNIGGSSEIGDPTPYPVQGAWVKSKTAMQITINRGATNNATFPCVPDPDWKYFRVWMWKLQTL